MPGGGRTTGGLRPAVRRCALVHVLRPAVAYIYGHPAGAATRGPLFDGRGTVGYGGDAGEAGFQSGVAMRIRAANARSSLDRFLVSVGLSLLSLLCPQGSMPECRRCGGAGHFASFSTRATVTSRRTCTSNGMRAKPSFGWSRSVWNEAMDLYLKGANRAQKASEYPGGGRLRSQ